jgi:hypothetical protein
MDTTCGKTAIGKEAKAMAEARRRLYIAYGSNLNLEQMARRCPTATVVGAAVMRNWRLVFNGVATIERFKGGEVSVLVWELQPDDEAALDVYEGWPRMYRKEMVRVRLDGKQVYAMVYIMNHGRQSPPNRSYYNIIREGYVSAGFDVSILREAVQRSRERGGAVMNPTIKEQILAVRDIGETNMLDVDAVMRIAIRESFYELVDYLMEHKREYVRFIFSGNPEEDV